MENEDIITAFNTRLFEIAEGNLDNFSTDSKLAQEVFVGAGPVFGAVALHETSTKTLAAYATGELELPAEKRAKLALLKTLTDLISSKYDNETTRAFLRGSNSILGDKAALELIADATPEELAKVARNVGNAALAFVFGG